MTSEDSSSSESLLSEIGKELAPLADDRTAFYGRLLQLAFERMYAAAGVVFLYQEDELKPIANSRFLDSNIQTPDGLELLRENIEFVQDVYRSGEPRWKPDLFQSPQLLPGWRHSLLLPVASFDTIEGVVELIFPESVSLEGDLTGFSQLVSLPLLPAEERVRWQASLSVADQTPLETPAASQSAPQEMLEFSRQLNRSLRVNEVAGIAVNQIAYLLPAERVTVLVQRGRKLVVLECSGREKVQARSQLVHRLRMCVSALLSRQAVFAYPEEVEELPDAARDDLFAFVREAESAQFLMLPLFLPAPLLSSADIRDEPFEHAPDRAVFGALVIETGRVTEPPADWRWKAEQFATQVEGPLANAEKHQRMPLRPVWNFLGGITDWLQGRRLVKLMALLGVLFLVIVSLFLWPWTYHVSGEGELLPENQRYVFAPFDGEILQVLPAVETGALIETDQPLLLMRNDDLETRWAEFRNRKQLKLAELDTLQVKRETVRRDGERSELIQVQGEIDAVQVELDGIEEQLTILKTRREKSSVLSPRSGRITTFQPRQLLAGRAVSRGEKLLEVMDESQGWRLELTIEERRLGHIKNAIDERDGAALPVEFFLATEPETTYAGTLQLVAVRPAADPEKGSVIQVFVELPDSADFQKRIGATVQARIDCGRKSLGYVIFGDFIEFLQQRFWF